jgi:outer membrane lipoprotein SlyB
MNVVQGVTCLFLITATSLAHADNLTVDAAIGGGIGGALGGAAGAEIGGREGAIIGSAAGAAIGTTINTQVEAEPLPSYREPSRFCPPGQAKKGRC